MTAQQAIMTDMDWRISAIVTMVYVKGISSCFAQFGEEFQAAFFGGLGGEAAAFGEFSIQEVE